MNKVILMGRLTKEPEVNHSSNTAFARFSIAVDCKFKKEGEPDADFFNCVAFGKLAETFEKYVRKGTKVVVTGEIRNENYTNKEGVKTYGVKIYVNEMEFAESKGTSDPVEQAKNTDFLSIPEGLIESLPFA